MARCRCSQCSRAHPNPTPTPNPNPNPNPHPNQVAPEEAKAALAEKGIVAPEAAAPEEAEAEASLMEKIKAALPKSLSKVFGDDK